MPAPIPTPMASQTYINEEKLSKPKMEVTKRGYFRLRRARSRSLSSCWSYPPCCGFWGL